jgi:hypothetical protein
MNVPKLLLLIAISAFCGAMQAQAPVRSSKPRNVTGHYQLKSGEKRNSLEVLELRGGKIKFHILALWVSPYNSENVHNGEVMSIVALDGNSAVYKDENCSITIKFLSDKAVVTQAEDVGDCDFGANVNASGSYRKLNSRRPKFDF